MPTTTFFNLPEEKREKILCAIREEFSRVQFDKVSINKIVKAAGISRGSFYQYFADKYDMLSYLLSDYHQQLFAHARENLIATGGDVFEVFSDMLDFAVKFVTEEKTNSFFKNILADVKISAGLYSQHPQKQGVSMLLEQLAPYMDLNPLDVRSEDDFPNMIEILASTTRDAVAKIFHDMSQYESVQSSYAAKLALLKRGFLKSKGEVTSC